MIELKIPFSPPDITEEDIDMVAQVMRSGWITTGPVTKQFEKDIAQYCSTEKAVCMNSATAALELTLRLLGIGPGDEVITSAYTYTASASVIMHVGATPVLIDVDPGRYNMSVQNLEKAITPKTKAIIPIDLGGIPCDYNALYKTVSAQKGCFQPANKIQEAIGHVIILTDAAHSLGARSNGVIVGSLGDFTCFSFHAVKNLTTAEGGAVTWKPINGISSDEIYKQYMLLSLHGQTKDALAKTGIGHWEYDILIPGYKCNMTDIMSAMGVVQLRKYEATLARRKQIIEFYNHSLSSSPVTYLPHYTDTCSSSGHLYLTNVIGADTDKRNEIIKKMAEKEISLNVHYKPLPLLTAYKNLGFDILNYPNSYNLYRNEITLPVYNKMTDLEAEYVITNYVDILGENK